MGPQKQLCSFSKRFKERFSHPLLNTVLQSGPKRGQHDPKNANNIFALVPFVLNIINAKRELQMLQDGLVWDTEVIAFAFSNAKVETLQMLLESTEMTAGLNAVIFAQCFADL